MARIAFAVLVTALICTSAASLRGAAPIVEDEPAIVASDLLQPASFPDASYGMAVEDARDGDVAVVVTTGAEFSIDKAAGTIECRQRIAKARPVAKLTFAPGSLSGIKLTHRSSGAAIFAAASIAVRINGDSLLMVSPQTDGPIVAEIAFAPDYHAEFKGNYNFFDPYGGISFFNHAKHQDSKLDVATDPVRVTWAWKAGDVFWAGVSPPKPYDWEKSIRDRVVLHGANSARFMFPDDLALLWLARVSKFTVLYLHNENMWRHWQRDLRPTDETEYLRVMKTARAEGMKVIVYASPKHFTEGTSVQQLAREDVDDPRCTGWNSGSNAKLYMWQAKRLVEHFDTPGFYWDEAYCNPKALAANYFVTRSTRKLIGDSGPFYFHCTEDVIGDRRGVIGVTHCPTIHAYFDAIYKGEGVKWDRVDKDFPGYVRYNLGTYNISNTIAIPCLSWDQWPDTAMLDSFMKRGNIRLIMTWGSMYSDKSVLWWHDYLPRLTPKLKEELEPTLLQRTGLFDEYRKAQAAHTDVR